MFHDVGKLFRPDFFIENNYNPLVSYDIPGTKLARSIYENIPDEHMLIATCGKHNQFHSKTNMYSDTIVRAIMIEK